MGAPDDYRSEQTAASRPAIKAKVRMLAADEGLVPHATGIDVLVGRSAADHLDPRDGQKDDQKSAEPIIEVVEPNGFADALRARFTDGRNKAQAEEIHLDHVETVAAYYAAVTQRVRRGRR